MRIQPKETFFSTSLWLAESIVELDKIDKSKPGNRGDITMNEAHLKNLKFITENTHKLLCIPLADAEAVVSSVPREMWNKDYERPNNKGDVIRMPNGSSCRIIDIYRLLKESYSPVVKAVVSVIKDYSMEYRVGGASEVPDWMQGQEVAP